MHVPDPIQALFDTLWMAVIKTAIAVLPSPAAACQPFMR
jgi:hypothetical protein